MLKRKNHSLTSVNVPSKVTQEDGQSMITTTRTCITKQQSQQGALRQRMNQFKKFSSPMIVVGTVVAIYSSSFAVDYIHWQPPSAHAFVIPVSEHSHRRLSHRKVLSRATDISSFDNLLLSLSMRITSLKESSRNEDSSTSSPSWGGKILSTLGTMLLVSSLSLACISSGPVFAENELSAKYGSKGFDTSLVDQNCLLNSCSIQVKNCLQDDADCRKGLTCTAKCLGDNACITGCMARYGNDNLDQLLKCTIEDNECIKVAILDGGTDAFGSEPLSPAPVVSEFNIASLTGSWYKVIGYNPNYDCYACQRNTFSLPSTVSSSGDGMIRSVASLPKLSMDVEFSMPHLLPDGSPLPPTSVRESLMFVGENNDEFISTMRSIGLNDYRTRETMIFDQGYLGTMNIKNNKVNAEGNDDTVLTLNGGTSNELKYRRTAHSEGEMFGLKFWENWYVIGENDPNDPEEFKFIYYNGKTRQNRYNGAFIYSRTKELSETSMKKIYKIAVNAGMNPDQFCRIRNGCFPDEIETTSGVLIASKSSKEQPLSREVFRGIIKSTRISELLGVEPVEARDTIQRNVPTAKILTPDLVNSEMALSSSTDSATDLIKKSPERRWWNEVGDYFENPHRHFQVMDELRVPMQWPK